jgi:ketosteroid isomerase-like protein
MTKESLDFEQFMRAREKAAQAYVQGDAAPLGELSAGQSPASFFGPQGGSRSGAQEVSAAYTRDAATFEPGSESHFEVLHQSASEGIGYWVGFQHAQVKLRGQPAPVRMKLRITELFRREGGEWKLMHRHADSLAEPKER